MDALNSMQNFLRGRPKTFKSVENAIEWRYIVLSMLLQIISSAGIYLKSRAVNRLIAQISVINRTKHTNLSFLQGISKHNLKTT